MRRPATIRPIAAARVGAGAGDRGFVAGLVALVVCLCLAAPAPAAQAITGTLIVEATGLGSGYPPTVATDGALTEGPDGAMWLLGSETSVAGTTRAGVAQLMPSGVFRFSPATSGAATMIGTDGGIASGPDRALWFTGGSGDPVIGRMTTSGTPSIFSLPPGDTGPYSIISGPDRALWFVCDGSFRATCEGSVAIGRITTAGQVTFVPLPSDQESVGDTISAIADGPGATVWVSVANSQNPAAPQAGFDSIAPDGQITELPVTVSDVQDMVLGPDGAMWFTDSPDNSIGRIAASGQLTSYRIPTPQSQPTGITAGPDGALWFTEHVGDKLGRITTAGHITEYPLGSTIPYAQQLQPDSIASGPGGTVWFTTDATNPSIVGYVTPGSGSQTRWHTIASRPPGPTAAAAPKLTGRLPRFVRRTRGQITLTLRFSGRGSVIIGISADPRSLAVGYQYRHTFAVRRGANHLHLRAAGLAAGNHTLFVFPLKGGVPTSKSYIGRIVVSG